MKQAIDRMADAFDGMAGLCKRVQAENMRLLNENFILRCQLQGMALVPADVLRRTLDVIRAELPSCSIHVERATDELATFLPKE